MKETSFKNVRILVVEDDASLRLLTRTALEQAGFLVEEAENGQIAIEAARAGIPDVILMDVEMPVLDGFSACKQIRNIPEFYETPIVMLTGCDDDASINKAYECGATDFINKPFNWSLLGQRVKYIVRASRVKRGLRVSEDKNRALVRSIPDSLLVVSERGILLTHHEGTSGSRLIDGLMEEGKSIYDCLPKSLADLWRQQIVKVLATQDMELSEHRASKKSKDHFYESRVVPYTKKSVLIMLRDVTEQKQAAAKVRRLAFYDTLTGLPNRQSFLIQLADSIRDAEKDGSRIGVIYVDIDNFKLINDSLGHSVGDSLLKDIANRITHCVRSEDVISSSVQPNTSRTKISRLGGDEFTLLLRGITNLDEVDSIAARLVKKMKEPLQCSGHSFVITPSVGIAVYPDDGNDLESLMKNADIALHHAKAAGRDRITRFSGTMSVRSLERLDIEDALRRALHNDDLELHYQPKYSLGRCEVVGVEALLRWNHPERGPISPAKFIPIAEDSGMIIELSDWVLHKACDQLQSWQGTPLNDIRIAINLSAKQFQLEDLHTQIFRALKSRSIDLHKLEVELTEGALMRDVESTIVSLNQIKEAGLSIAVDDFGTGYSSMSYLKRFPIDALKIDQSFVNEIHSSEDSHSICKAIVALGHGLGMKIIAEGVENHQQLQLLHQMGCDEIQGYFFARPMSADDVKIFIADRKQQRVSSLPQIAS